MKLNSDTDVWEALATALWNAETGELSYDRRDGVCSYATDGDASVGVSGICGVSAEGVVLPVSGQ